MSSLSSEIVSVKDKVVECRDTLKQILIDKKIEGLENENRLSVLIDRVNLLRDYEYPKLRLYRDGDECTSVTGGYGYDGQTAFKKYSTYIEQTLSVAGWTTIRPNNYIDFTPYKKLVVEYYAKQTKLESSPYANCCIQIYNSSNTQLCSYDTDRGGTIKTMTIDLTNINVSARFRIYFSLSSSHRTTTRLHKAWLEK